tara:strand:+ start:41 stop:148 length:108 start_codon:yes stop_codon:yes gene_type:complete
MKIANKIKEMTKEIFRDVGWKEIEEQRKDRKFSNK